MPPFNLVVLCLDFILFRRCFEVAETLSEILSAKFMVQCEELSDESFRSVSQVEDEETKRAMVFSVILRGVLYAFNEFSLA